MDRMKKITEEIILISFFVSFFSISFYFALYGRDFCVKSFAITSATFSAKTFGLSFCRATGLIKEHKAHILSYKITAFLVLPMLAAALLIKCFF